jgi:hypothetical protein
MTRDFYGGALIPGVNADELDIQAGLDQARRMDYGHWKYIMVAEYALMRHAKGEEKGAQDSALSGGIDLTSWYAILAAARAGAQDG